MAIQDVRQFIEALDKTGDVVRIKDEVDWELEAAAISRRAYERYGPAVFFEKIKDYPEGYRIFNGSLGTYRRVAIALGLAPDTPVRGIQEEYERREANPIKPKLVTDGPCKENVMLGDDVDLYQFPAPVIHDGDGGRYLGTWDILISHDPDTGWNNWGMYRFMIHNKHSIVGFPDTNSHFGMVFFGKYVPKNQPMPAALVIGADPLSHMVATAGYRIGEDEADFASALMQAPIELIKCETSDLLVPARAEIVIEGDMLPDKTATEGPFGEYPGYRTQGAHMSIVMRVKAITYRNSPIISMISLGMPVDDSSLAAAMTTALAVKRRLKRYGVPVTDVYVPPHGVTHLVIVGVKKGGAEVAKGVTNAVWSRRKVVSKIMVVDEDVDVFDIGQVLHAFGTKCHPGRGITIFEDEGVGNPLTPYYSREERRRRHASTVLFDCTWPSDWKDEDTPFKSSFENMYPKEVKDKVLADWSRFGFE
jgi:4-hydroxy-3-polyprenylbenzoate decarboxylase